MADQPTLAELDQAVLELRDNDLGIRVDTWKSYSLTANFLTPSDGWSCSLGDDSIGDKIIGVIKPGMRIRWSVAGHTQLDGYVRKVNIQSSRGGTNITLEGNDGFGPVVHGTMDPTVRFAPGQTVLDVLKTVFGPFGWSTDDQFRVGNDENLRTILGTGRVKTNKKGKPLKSCILHQLRPYPHEGCFQFASRICQRYGFWIWPSADGTFVVCGTPTFDYEPLYQFTNRRGANVDETLNNVVESSVDFSDEEMPALIIATGFGSGGEVAHSHLKAAMVNELTLDPANGAKHPDVVAALAKHSDAKIVPSRPYFTPAMRYKQASARIVYLHDDDSKTFDQLDAFVRREMAKAQCSSLRYHVTVKGHSQAGMPYAVNVMSDVQDDVCNVHEPLWVLSRTFTKDRRSGTLTKMELIRPYTLDFFQP